MPNLPYAGMLKSSARSVIRLRGVRHNNLKNFDLELPLKRLIVITGLSGSGKSSLAFDTLFAEGQRRYIETFSPYARQFFDRMDKPQVDSIEGIPPAIAIEQRNAVRTTRSTVGTMTEICEYMKVLWPQVARLHCRQCGRPVRKESPQEIWTQIIAQPGAPNTEWLITFELPLSEKLSLADSLALIAKQGYQRLLQNGKVIRIEEIASRLSDLTNLKSGAGSRATPPASHLSSLTVIQDRLQATAANRPRFVEACEQAYHFGKGKLALWLLNGNSGALQPRYFSNRLHCATCDLEYREPSPALFSFNNPVGACPTCRGFGRVIGIDYSLVMPDRSKSLAGGVVKPWQIGHGLESQHDLLRMCRHLEIPTDVPFEKLPKKWQTFVIEGEPDYGKDEEHEWPRAWYGVKGYFRWLESKAYKMHVRVLLSRYRSYTTCPDCLGKRFQPETLLYRLPVPVNGATRDSARARPQPVPTLSLGSSQELTLADFYQLPIRDALELTKELRRQVSPRAHDALGLVLDEVCSRLGYLNDVGLAYLTLDRPTRSLSGGETERVNLTTCLGTRLVNTLFVLDEPSVGLHPRDTDRLVRILQQLRDAGNTVVVVEHEASVMRAADQILDLGPGHGATGGEVVFQGSYAALLRASHSLTGQYLSGQKQIQNPTRRSVSTRTDGRHNASAADEGSARVLFLLKDAPGSIPRVCCPSLRLAHANRHNLKDLTVEIPLHRFVCVTGVSGSGKTTLIREELMPALESKLDGTAGPATGKASDRLDPNAGTDDTGLSSSSTAQQPVLEGWEALERVVLVDQSILGKTPRSNPAVYIGAFDDIREFFAQSELARQRGLNASAFSFNSAQGQCERCRGAGFEKIEMQFLSDVFIRCPECNGRRYRPHILEIKIGIERESQPQSKLEVGNRQTTPAGLRRQNRRTKSTRAKSELGLSIADLLEITVEEAVAFLAQFPESRPAQRAVVRLRLLAEVGLGYLKLGQPINTLSGGESQRLKLVRHLAESDAASGATNPAALRINSPECQDRRSHFRPQEAPGSTLFLFDEPTTGLHFDDVRVLLKVFQRLVDAGHSVVVIEHNLDVIKSADWVLDLGPDAGDQGGQLVATGTPERIAACPNSHTGKALRETMNLRRANAQKPQQVMARVYGHGF